MNDDSVLSTLRAILLKEADIEFSVLVGSRASGCQGHRI